MNEKDLKEIKVLTEVKQMFMDDLTKAVAEVDENLDTEEFKDKVKEVVNYCIGIIETLDTVEYVMKTLEEMFGGFGSKENKDEAKH